MHLWSINLRPRRQEYTIEKRQAFKWYWENWTATCKNNEIRTYPNTTHKNKLKMDQRPKCEAGLYKILRRKHRQNPDINCSNIFFEPPLKEMKIKTQINKFLFITYLLLLI